MFYKWIFSILTLLILIFVPIACEDMDEFFIDCNECYGIKEPYHELSIRFSIDKENPKVFYTLYKGYPDDGEVVEAGFTSDRVIYYTLEVGCFYSVVAQYYRRGRLIKVYDGKEFRLKLIKDQCSTKCYALLGSKLDARCRY